MTCRAMLSALWLLPLFACSSNDGVAENSSGGASSGGGSGFGGDSGGFPSGGSSSGGSAGVAVGGAGGSTVDPCESISGQSYSTLPTSGPVSDKPAPQHADLNIHLRNWSKTGSTLGLIDLAGPTDALAPKLNSMFTDDRVPAFLQNYRVNDWDWGTNTATGPITTWDVTLAGFQTTPGEVLELPKSGYDIGQGKGARVLYAADDTITLKYTADDNVVSGYTIHIVNLCVEPSLKALYDDSDAAGRSVLPALSPEQPLGRARAGEILVAIRDTGSFMDPRAKKDWW